MAAQNGKTGNGCNGNSTSNGIRPSSPFGGAGSSGLSGVGARRTRMNGSGSSSSASSNNWVLCKRGAAVLLVVVAAIVSLKRSMKSVTSSGGTTYYNKYAEAGAAAGGGAGGGGLKPVSGWAVPLTMSLAAGMSTCLGAATVFLAKERVGHTHLAFALSLAASVMVTVSLASILPEAFRDGRPDAEHEYIQFGTFEFVQRCTAFNVGSSLYILISKFALPDPDEILALEATTESAAEDQQQRLEQGQPSAKQRDYDDEEETSVLVSQNTNANRSSRKAVRRSKRSSSAFIASSPRNTFRNEAYNLSPPLSLRRDPPPPPPLSVNSSASGGSTGSSGRLAVRTSFSWDDNDDSGGCGSSPDHQNGAAPPPPPSTNCWARFARGSDLPTHEARRAWRVAMLLFVSLAVHNFPEGLAVAASAMHSEHLGLTTTIAIALHNIPEGIAIAIPCLAARPDAPWLAFGLASLSGLAEPLGALAALAVLHRRGDGPGENTQADGIPNDLRSLVQFSVRQIFDMDNVLAFVAGIMIFVAVIELFPEARRHMNQSKWPGAAGTIVGAVVMLASDAFLDT